VISVITIYGTDWCEDTQRSLRHLRRLGVAHEYVNIDEDLDALERAKALNGGRRRTPVIDLGFGGAPLVEPDNDLLSGALVERDMLTRDDVHERLGVQNVGDVERVLRTLAGAALLIGARVTPPAVRWPIRMLGALLGVSGLSGWCPVYHAANVTSIGGPGDRPEEITRPAWLAPRRLPPSGGAAIATAETHQ
jgi:mycoredoxin